MEFRFLTQQFFLDFPVGTYSEMERKTERPYAHLGIINVEIHKINYTIAIPIRSNIRHQYALFSIPEENKGLDFSKLLIIDPLYVDTTKTAYINTDEHLFFMNKKHFIKKKAVSYINLYIKKYNVYQNGKLKEEPIIKYSTLKYFHKELGIQ